MTVVNWLASDTASWIFFGIGMLSAALAIVDPLIPPLPWRSERIQMFFTRLAAWSPLVVGPVLVLVGTLLAATTAGKLSWLSILAGAVCLAVLEFRTYGAYRSLKLASRREVAKGRIVREVSISAPSRAEIVNALSRRIAEWGVLPSRGVGSFEDFANSMTRSGVWAPVSVYTAADDGTKVKDAVAAVLREFELAIAVEEPPVTGSWFQRFWVWIRDVVGSKSMRGRLAKLEEAIQLEYLGKRRAEIDKAKADAVAALLGAIKEQENVIVRIGSIVAIKTQGDLVVFTISEMEAAALEKNSDLLGDPVAALKFLRGIPPLSEQHYHHD